MIQRAAEDRAPPPPGPQAPVELPTVESPWATPSPASRDEAMDVGQVADRVYDLLVARLARERESRGL